VENDNTESEALMNASMIEPSAVRELTLADRERLLSLKKDIRMSFYNFTNLFIWRKPIHLRVREIGGCVCLSSQWRAGRLFAYYPLGESPDLRAILKTIRDTTDAKVTLGPLDERMAGEVKALFPDAELRERRGLCDYVYRYEDLTELKGDKYHGKKNHYNRFIASYDWEYIEIGKDNRDLLKQAAETFRPEGDGELADEYRTVEELIAHFDAFSLHAAVLKANGAIAAYSIGEVIDGDTALIHIEKGDRTVSGAYAAINRLFLQNSFRGCAYVNREEDMGLEGLRKAKLSYHPCRLDPVYEVDLDSLPL